MTPAVDDELAARFHRVMAGLPDRTKLETGYVGSYFARMVAEEGGVEAARRLLATDKPSEGFTSLWELGRLDLSVEAHVASDEFAALFSRSEAKIAKRRLEQYGYSL